MKILVMNRGSSSIKCSMYHFAQFPEHTVDPVWEQESGEASFPISQIPEEKIDCIGHRIVHGGAKYRESIEIDAEVKREIRRLADLAPLHNLADLEGIEALEKRFPGKPQIAVFDTAFHRSLPEAAAIYPGPFSWSERGIRRYGFHGTSFQYCSRRAAEILGSVPKKMVICHLGSGASLCAVKEGKSIDTTMGFTPLEGLMMDTRSGTVDPGILLYLLEKEGKSVAELSKELYEKSGLLGLSGVSGDMREVLEKKSERRAQLAIDVYIHRLICQIGSMVASLGGMDTLVFTAGIGENSPFIRKCVCDRLAFFGVELQEAAAEGVCSSPHSKVKVLVIATQEAFEIARECWKKIDGSHSNR